MMKTRHFLTAVFATAISALVIPACGTNDAGLSGKSGRNNGNDDGTGGTGDGEGGEGGSGGDGEWVDPGELEDAGPEECAADSQKAERMPLDMYIMLDKSGSMAWNNKGDTVSGGASNPASRWYQVTEALKAFVADSGSAGMGVGLQYFPQSQACSVPAYRNPTIGISLLPMAATSLTTSLDNTKPSGGTPTRPALEGALEYAKDWSDTHPGHSVIVVLATDGEPDNSCNPNTVSSISNLAGQYEQNHGIKTFVIGIGSATGNLNTIAAAGGTGQAFMVTGSNAQQEFIDAMNEIRGVALACEYFIPDPKDGETLDYSKVNMRFTKGDGTETDLVYVGDAASCGSGGWFYDDAAAPTKILVCPETCETFKADGEGQVDILLGCKRREPA